MAAMSATLLGLLPREMRKAHNVSPWQCDADTDLYRRFGLQRDDSGRASVRSIPLLGRQFQKICDHAKTRSVLALFRMESACDHGVSGPMTRGDVACVIYMGQTF